MAETSSSDHGRNRFLCVLFFFYFLSTLFQMLPNKHGYLTALQGPQLAAPDCRHGFGVLYGHYDERAAVQSHHTH